MNNIEDLLDDYHIECRDSDHRHGTHGRIQINCPYCDGSGDGFHMGISMATGACSCWKCGGKSLPSILSYITRRSFKEVKDDLSEITYAFRHAIKKSGHLLLPQGRGVLLPGHETYLRGRGFDPDEIVGLWGVQGMGQGAKIKSATKEGKYINLSWRIFIPIHHNKEIVSWTSRTINKENKLRYISAPAEYEDIPHKSILYGADYCEFAAIIHEGPIDVWATGPGAIATCGTAYTTEQLLAMSKYLIRVVCFDSSDAAQARGKVLAHELSLFSGRTYNVKLESGEDAGAADPEELVQLRQQFLNT